MASSEARRSANTSVPIGQFNFVQSLVSPLEVTVRDADVCHSCRTKDCIRGTRRHPRLRAEPVSRRERRATWTARSASIASTPARTRTSGFSPVIPGRQLLDDARHSGIGRLEQRPDLAALILVLVFGAYANAAGMVAPVVAWQDRLGDLLGDSSRMLTITAFYLLALIVLPGLMVGAATALSRRWGGLAVSRLSLATRFSYALVPLGFGMWLAHYGFHFLTSYAGVYPRSSGSPRSTAGRSSESPRGSCSCCGPVPDWLPRLEILFLDVGLLLSLFTGYRIAIGLLFASDPGVEGVRPLGCAEPAPLRGRSLDRPPADADAGHDAGGELTSSGVPWSG